MPTLNLSDDLKLPLDAVTQTFSILAKRGMGKTWTAMVMAEEMIQADLHVCYIDPIGVAWGMRLSASGKRAGLPIHIIGGDHGDLPLNAESGALIADLIMEEGVNAVLDLSLLRKNEQDRFVTAFAERLYHKNRKPLHVFVDEADAFAPQRPLPDQRRMLGAMEDLVRRGRARGLGLTLVTQRSAVLNKNVLTQTEALICLRTIAPQDRAAIDAWVEAHGTEKQRAQMMADLASLPIGTAYFWSPGWLDVFKKIKIRRRATFDSSATPTVGSDKFVPKTLAPVEIKRLETRMRQVIEKAKADDPKLLRQQVTDLRAQLQKAQASTNQQARIQERVDLSEKPQAQQRAVLQQEPKPNKRDLKQQKRFTVSVDKLTVTAGRLEALSKTLLTNAEALRKSSRAVATAAPIVPAPSPAPRVFALNEQHTTHISRRSANSLGRCERSILQVLVQHGPSTINRIAILTGYRVSGGFKNSLSRLREMKCIVGSNNEAIAATEYAETFGPFPALPTGAGLRLYWLTNSHFGACEKKILEVIISSYPTAMKIEEIAERTGYQISGGFKNSLSRLRTAGLLEGRNADAMRATATLFD